MSEFMQDAFEGALLAEVVYSNNVRLISDSSDTKEIIELLGSSKVSESKATYFANNFQVIATSFDHLSGYDGMLVKNIHTGQYWLVNRGTEISSPTDVIADLDLMMLSGTAGIQLTDMENFYQQLLNDGLLPPDAKLNVAGHSLGGHLTTLFVKSHDDVVNEAFTYNGAGVDELPSTQDEKKTFISQLKGLVDAVWPGELVTTLVNLIQQGFPTQKGSNKIRNFIAEEGAEVIPSAGSLYGEIYFVDTAAKSGSVFGKHSITNLADALFVDYQLSRIDSSLDIDTLGKVTGNADNNPSKEHETLAFGLSQVFGFGELDGVDAYSRLAEIADSVEGSGYRLVSLSELSVGDLLDLLQADTVQGRVARFSVLNNLPVLSVGDFTDIAPSFSDNFQYDVQDQYSEAFWTDRLQALGLTLIRNGADGSAKHATEEGHTLYINLQTDDQVYGDGAKKKWLGLSSNAKASKTAQVVFGSTHNDTINGGDKADRIYGLSGGDIIHGGKGNDYIEGGIGNDVLYGDEGIDTLLGGAGDDTLNGGKGIDILDGGTGANTFIIDKDGGIDFIRGQDHTSDTLQLERHVVSGIVKLRPGGGIGEDAYGNRYLKTDTGLVIVDKQGSRAVIEYWQDGDFGLSLVEDASELPTIPTHQTTLTIQGDRKLIDQDLEEDGVQVGYDNLNNEITDPEEVDVRTDILFGSKGNDWIKGEGGNDFLDGGAGNDVLEGGSGTDILYGGSGDDFIIASTIGDVNDVLTSSGLESGSDRDFLSGGDGADVLVGNAGSNVLSGGGGKDKLYGGAGNDYLIGDKEYLAQDFDWQATERSGVTVFSPVIAQESTLGPNFGDDDEIYAGKGNDHAWGGAGNDRILGEAGDDTLFGEAGNDVIDGGSGDDTIHGDASYLDAKYHGNDVLYGGIGNDDIVGGGGDDVLIGGEDNDVLWGDSPALAGEYHGDDLLLGGQGKDTLVGGGGNDVLFGGDGNDTLHGDNSPDNLDGKYHGDDVLYGGNGDDTLYGGGGNDMLYGEDGDDILVGDDDELDAKYQGDDYLDGGDGDDTLYGMGGNDILIGGAGDDTLVGDSDKEGAPQGNDLLDGGEGDDNLWGMGGDDVLLGGDGDDFLVGGEGDDRLLGGNDNDTLLGQQGVDWLEGGDGNDLLVGGAGNDKIWGGAGDDVIYGDDGPSSIYLTDAVPTTTGEAGNDEIWGGDGNDWIYGEGGNDELHGGAGNDVIYGGEGSDRLWGDDGNDVLYGGPGNDFLYGGAGNDILVGGGGIDQLSGGEGRDIYVVEMGSGLTENVIYINDTAGNTLQFGAGISSGMITLGLGSLMLRVDGEEMVHIEDFDPDDIYANPVIDRFEFEDGTVWDYDDLIALGFDLYGTDDDDVISGTATTDRLEGKAGNDLLIGKAGDDYLDGGTGADIMLGGAGNDTYVVDNALDVVAEEENEGIDTVLAKIDYALTANVENLTLIDAALVGTGNELDNLLLGNELDNTLYGGAGNDELDGGAGADMLIGGTGDDIYWVDNIDDVVIEEAGEGIDTVRSFVDYTLAAEVENLELQGTENLQGTGNELHNILTGNSGNNTLYGEAGDDQLFGLEGDDTLYGGAGHDVLDGGAGNDVLIGGTGDDIYYVDNPNDVVIEQANEGFDTVYATSDYTLSDHVEKLVLVEGNQARHAIGSNGDNVLVGNSADNILDGKQGSNTLIGGKGNDTYIVHSLNDTIVEQANEGIDTVQTSMSYTLGEHLENLELTGSEHINATGNTLNNLLIGNAGNNILDGVAGANILKGGDGDDYYIVRSDQDEVIELENEGNDTVELRYRSDKALAGGVENLILAAGVLNGLGNELDNTITGNAADNTLDGGNGNDTLIGGAGNDTYYVDSPDDVVIEQAHEGYDTVVASSDYTLSDHVEELVMAATWSAYHGVGNAQDNVLHANDYGNWLEGKAGNDLLIGGASNDILDGGEGADTMIGGQGDDTYVVDNINDVVVELADEGNDTVESFIDYTLGEHLENLTLLGSDNLTATGNQLDNILTGNRGDNLLDGISGQNTLYGGAGDDYYIAHSAQDRIVEYADEGTDTLERHFDTTLVLENNVENLVLGSGVIHGNGNELNNTIYGNAEDNTLAGLDGDDVLYGEAGNDALFGGRGNDTLYGGSDKDYLDGGEGVDVMVGGTGDDVYIVDNVHDVVIEQADEGTDQVQTTVTFTLPEHVEHLFLMDNTNINGTGNELDNFIAGNSGNNVLDGKAGDDTLQAGLGNNLLIGGTGNDKYVIDLDSDHNLIDNTGGGYDGIFFQQHVSKDDLHFSQSGNDLLIGIGDSAEPLVIVKDHFLGGDAAISYVQPSSGYAITAQTISQLVAAQTSQGDYDQVIKGTQHAEQLVGSNGNDLIEGFAGNDVLFGMAGDDTLLGGEGDDYLAGGNGSGFNSGNDRLEGGAGNDTLSGEDGINRLIGGTGDDKYVYGGGQDTIDNTGGGFDGLFFNNGITANDLIFTQDNNDLVIYVQNDPNQMVRVLDHFLGGDMALNYVQPASGYMLDVHAINSRLQANPFGDDNTPDGSSQQPEDDEGQPDNTTNPVDNTAPSYEFTPIDYDRWVPGSASSEQLVGSNQRDLMYGGKGNDQLFGMKGDDILIGGAGDDYLSGGSGSFSGSGTDVLFGGAGDDTLVGEDGNNVLVGGTGNDSYLWQQGSGLDLIDNLGGGQDWLFFNGVTRDRLSFHRDDDDLVINVDGNDLQGVRILNHFADSEHAMSYIQPADGYAIPASQIDSLLTPMPVLSSEALAITSDSFERLVNAMASFHPDSGVMASNVQSALDDTTLIGTTYSADYGQERLQTLREAV